MNSLEWLKEEGSIMPNTPKWTQVGTQMFMWTTTPTSRTRQQSRNIKRQDKKRKGEENEGKNKGNKQEKREGWGKQRKRESENVSGLKTKSEKKKVLYIFFLLREKTKYRNTKAKAQHKGKTTVC